jgi:diguanylate cyclase (GGDEF)-like protein/PAS domain S-box-containing protein
MQKPIEFYVPFIYLLAAVPYVWLGLHAWRKRPAVAVTPFAWAMLGMSIWSFTYSLEIFFPSLPIKLFVTKIEYIGIVSIPVFLLFFSLEFTGNSHLLALRTRLLLWSIPLAILLLVWTNESHHLMWDMATVTEMRGLKLLDVRYGLFFWIQIVFSYVLGIFASILLIMEMIQRPGIYRIQISFVVLGILAPWVGSLIFVSKMNPIPNLDITPLLFLPTGIGLSWAIVRFRLLEILPLEHLSVLKNMKDGVIVLNSNQRVLYINPIAEKLFGRTENDAIGQPLAYVSEIYGEKLRPYLTGTEQRAEIMTGEDGQTTVFEATVSPVASQNSAQISAGPDSIITLHDITERKEMENALGRRESIMSAISLTAEQFLKEAAWEHNVPAVLAKIGQAVDVSRVYVAMNYMDNRHVLYSSLCYEWAAPGVTPQINNQDLRHIPLQQAGFNRWEKELSNNLPIQGLIEDFPESEQNLFKRQGSISVAAMPIFVENQWWGFIMFDECRNKRHWTDTELKALRTTASIFGSAESRARAEQKLIRRQKALSLLQDIVREALQAKSLRSMAEDLVDRLAKLIHASECFITLWDEASTQIFPLASYGTSRDTYLSLQPVSGEYTVTELVLQHGKSLIVDDAYNSQYLDHEIAKQCPSRSLIVLPLIAAKNKFGAIILAFKEYHRFQPEEIAICEQASSLIALAFEKFKAMEQAQRRADASETLRKASAAITETLEMEAAVTHILEQLNQVVPYDSASVQLLDGNELQIIGGRGWDNPDDIMGMRFTIPGDNPNSVVIETRKPYILPEVRKVHKAFSNPPHDHIRSWLGVPLIAQDRIIGLLAIDSAEPNHFTEIDINLASAFADQVAVALENARIFKETQDQAITDQLTGIYNRRGLFQIGEFEFLRARRINRPFSAMIFDIDHFKKINDQYGHATGDQALRGLAERCRAGSRAVDLIGRYGGEEFVVLLPETNLESARLVAERLRLSIMEHPFATDTDTFNITISIGVAEANKHDSLKTLIERADVALYKAKRTGRNRVMVNDAA